MATSSPAIAAPPSWGRLLTFTTLFSGSRGRGWKR